MGERGLHYPAIDLFRPLDTDRDLDLHRPRVDPERPDKSQRAVVDGILDGADSGLGVIATVQIVAATHLQDDALCLHARHHHAISSRTTAAALAITVLLVPASLGISSPPSTTRTVPVPCGKTARTACWSTRSGRGTPLVTPTCIASTGKPSALAILSPLCQSASRRARTAALVWSVPRMSVPMPICRTMRFRAMFNLASSLASLYPFRSSQGSRARGWAAS